MAQMPLQRVVFPITSILVGSSGVHLSCHDASLHESAHRPNMYNPRGCSEYSAAVFENPDSVNRNWEQHLLKRIHSMAVVRNASARSASLPLSSMCMGKMLVVTTCKFHKDR